MLPTSATSASSATTASTATSAWTHTENKGHHLWGANQPTSFDIIALNEQKQPVHSIKISKCTFLNSGALSILANLGQQLKCLELEYIPSKMSDFVWIYNVFSYCPNLDTLRLKSLGFNGFAEYLSKTKYGKEIKDLSLIDSDVYFDAEEKKMSDTSFKTLTMSLPKLNWLGIEGFEKLTSKGLSEIVNLKILTVLKLDNVPGVDDSVIFKILKECTSIVGLRLSFLNITDNSIGPIFESKLLKCLNLQNCQKISANALCLLGPHPTLELFVALDTNLDDRFLMNPPENLKIINISGCPISAKAIEIFRKAHPNIEVDGKPKNSNDSNGWFW